MVIAFLLECALVGILSTSRHLPNACSSVHGGAVRGPLRTAGG